MRASNENAAPAYNLTVDVDECYFVRGENGRAYLVSNSSHGADALRTFAMGFGDDSAPRKDPAYKRRPKRGEETWMSA